VVPRDARDRAYRRARRLEEALGADPRATDIAQLEFARELFAALAVELCADLPELRRLIDRVETVAGVRRVALGREVLRTPELLRLPTAVAIEAQLTLLLAFANAQAVSLWTEGRAGQPEPIAHAGEVDPDGDAGRLAAKLMAAAAVGHSPNPAVCGIVVDRGQQSPAALIARGDAASSADRALLLDIAAPLLTATFARQELLRRGRTSEPSATERRLSRMRFDLHDGPQQDVIMLAEDLHVFRDQLASVIEDAANRERALGGIDDLQARLVALDGDLRRISGALLSPFLQPESLPDAVVQLAEAFTARTQIEPEVELQGELTRLTDSQQIALLALIREALANIREHSDAKHVTISLSAGAHGVDATVTDDGRGFDPETTLVTAAREGHLGLVGMYERVRMLGGETKIDSRPGGPTVISVRLPAWPRVEDQAASSPFSSA
jgi:signal transduction histidine kinase